MVNRLGGCRMGCRLPETSLCFGHYNVGREGKYWVCSVCSIRDYNENSCRVLKQLTRGNTQAMVATAPALNMLNMSVQAYPRG